MQTVILLVREVKGRKSERHLPHVLPLEVLTKSPSPAYSQVPFRHWKVLKFSLEPSVLQAEPPQFSQPLFIEVLLTSDHPLPSSGLLQHVRVFLTLVTVLILSQETITTKWICDKFVFCSITSDQLNDVIVESYTTSHQSIQCGIIVC